MKAKIRGQKITGYYGPDMGEGRWLFVRSQNGRTYSVARVIQAEGELEIAEYDEDQALRGFTNMEIADALLESEG